MLVTAMATVVLALAEAFRMNWLSNVPDTRQVEEVVTRPLRDDDGDDLSRRTLRIAEPEPPSLASDIEVPVTSTRRPQGSEPPTSDSEFDPSFNAQPEGEPADIEVIIGETSLMRTVDG